MNRIFFSLLSLLSASSSAIAVTCEIKATDTFMPQKVPIKLVAKGNGPAMVFFKAKLRVNTDGAPNSYHPADPRGKNLAINNIINGVAVSKPGTKLSYDQKIAAFEQFRDAGWTVPSGYSIDWQNVLAATKVNGRTVPCIFQSGEHKGYFGSLTSLKNDLPADKRGECESLNQLDERVVPGLVLAKGDNPLRKFGVQKGDLVLALNPENGVAVAAVVADKGPPENLGEGSVALNMALLQKTRQPKTYDEAKTLDTGKKQMDVIVIPGSAGFEPAKPFSRQNIAARLASWQQHHGLDLADFSRGCDTGK